MALARLYLWDWSFTSFQYVVRLLQAAERSRVPAGKLVVATALESDTPAFGAGSGIHGARLPLSELQVGISARQFAQFQLVVEDGRSRERELLELAALHREHARQRSLEAALALSDTSFRAGLAAVGSTFHFGVAPH